MARRSKTQQAPGHVHGVEAGMAQPASPDVHWTPRAARILDRARVIAAEREVSFVGVEHLMLAILEDGASVATAAIERVTSTSEIERELVRILDSDGYAGRGPTT